MFSRFELMLSKKVDYPKLRGEIKSKKNGKDHTVLTMPWMKRQLNNLKRKRNTISSQWRLAHEAQ